MVRKIESGGRQAGVAHAQPPHWSNPNKQETNKRSLDEYFDKVPVTKKRKKFQQPKNNSQNTLHCNLTNFQADQCCRDGTFWSEPV